MTDTTRISQLNDKGIRSGEYVLYWMQQSQRAEGNAALEHALTIARELRLPVLVGFGLMDHYPEANQRHYQFMIEGLLHTRQQLRERGIAMVIRRGEPPQVALDLARDAAAVVCDRGYLVHQRRWRDAVADAAQVRVDQVEADVVVPVEQASDKAEYAARTIRPKISKHLTGNLAGPVRIKPYGKPLNVDSTKDIHALQDMSSLTLDCSVPASKHYTGGTDQARRHLREFIAGKLPGYATGRKGPADQAVSHLSMYLHFGQISPVEVAAEILGSPVALADKEAFIEQLIVRRELACNYVQYTPNYWTFDALPAWARRTLERHAADPRPVTYTREQLEQAQTHDPYWNAAMREMLHTGYMHNYMRMYWGKKVIEWKQSPREAFDDLLYLNNRYFIDGRDANSYVGVAWCFGLHDRPWTERPIFGQVRYMNLAGLERKFDMQAYVQWVDQAQGRLE